MRLKQSQRVILIGFTLALALVVGLWSYTSQAADINNSLTAGPELVRPNQTVVLTGQNFESEERVGIWVTYPNFKVYPVAEVRADGDGSFTFTYLPNFVGEPSGQYVYTARGHATGREVFAYLQVDTSQVQAGPSDGFTGLSVSPNATNQLGTVTITGRGYSGGEPVAVWVTYPDFSVEDIDTIDADSNGNFTLTFTPDFKGNGEYLFSANGNKSAHTFYAELQLGDGIIPDSGGLDPAPTAPDPTATPVPASANLTAAPGTITRNATVELSGSSFDADESISLWVTFPDGNVAAVDEIRANSDGAFVYAATPDYLDDGAPAGTYTYTARGNESGSEAFASVQFEQAQAAPAPDTPNDTGSIETTLSASPALARQNDTVTLEGRGFAANEMVAIWITYPSFEVFSVAEVETNADGNFTFPFLMDTLDATFTPTGMYTYTARGKSSGFEVYADVEVEIGVAPDTSTGVNMTVEPGQDDQGSYFIIRGANFGTNEALAIWLRYPDNRIADLGQIEAGPEGAFSYTLRADGVPTGRYAFTARGLRTDLNGITEFDITVADLTFPAGEANMVIRPADEAQRSVAVFEGSGFQPGEVVSVWVTLPDNSTLAIGDVQVDDGGAFVASLYLGEQEPIGMRAYTAYGNQSGLRAIADYTLFAGGPEPYQDPESDIVILSADQ